jgi:hypothetical protein
MADKPTEEKKVTPEGLLKQIEALDSWQIKLLLRELSHDLRLAMLAGLSEEKLAEMASFVQKAQNHGLEAPLHVSKDVDLKSGFDVMGKFAAMWRRVSELGLVTECEDGVTTVYFMQGSTRMKLAWFKDFGFNTSNLFALMARVQEMFSSRR